ncbi:MAG: protein kinase [Deltaproteobacteria bacterium]|nr:protein kinase [Deltaproteobacteria bacterium]
MTATLPTVGTVLDDKYEIEGFLGQGGMAAVFRAKHRYTHRTVAIKVLLPSIARDATVVERFLREARAVSALDHPAAVTVLDVGRTASGHYLVMEYLEGETLRARLARGSMPIDDALVILEPLVHAVAAAHARGIVHRDIKPDNVFLRRTEDGGVAPKLLDFGISKLTNAEALTLTGAVIGTPEYLAPEQVIDSSRTGPQTDVYQLGVLLYEMLTSVSPFSRHNYEAQLAAILTEEAPPLSTLRPEVGVELEGIVTRAMRRDLATRTPDARTLAQEIRTCRARSSLANAATIQSEPAPHPRTPVATPSPRPPNRLRTWAIPIALVLVLAPLTAFGAWILVGADDPSVPSLSLEPPAPTTGPGTIAPPPTLPSQLPSAIDPRAIDPSDAATDPIDGGVPLDDAQSAPTIRTPRTRTREGPSAGTLSRDDF